MYTLKRQHSLKDNRYVSNKNNEIFSRLMSVIKVHWFLYLEFFIFDHFHFTITILIVFQLYALFYFKLVKIKLLMKLSIYWMTKRKVCHIKLYGWLIWAITKHKLSCLVAWNHSSFEVKFDRCCKRLFQIHFCFAREQEWNLKLKKTSSNYVTLWDFSVGLHVDRYRSDFCYTQYIYICGHLQIEIFWTEFQRKKIQIILFLFFWKTNVKGLLSLLIL